MDGSGTAVGGRHAPVGRTGDGVTGVRWAHDVLPDREAAVRRLPRSAAPHVGGTRPAPGVAPRPASDVRRPGTALCEAVGGRVPRGASDGTGNTLADVLCRLAAADPAERASASGGARPPAPRMG